MNPSLADRNAFALEPSHDPPRLAALRAPGGAIEPLHTQHQFPDLDGA
jgi:hypothetical protein